MIEDRYEHSDAVTWIKNLGDLLNTEVKDNCLTLPGGVGEGFLYAGDLGNGMSFMYVNAIFHQDFLFHRSASEESGLVLYFTELHIAGYYKATSGPQEVIDRHKERKNVYLNSTRYPLEVHLTSQSRLRMVGVKFSELLVRKFIKAHNLVYIKNYTQHSSKNPSGEYLTPQVQKLLNEVYDANVQTPLGRMVLFNRILLLVEKFLHLFFIRELPSDKQYLPSEEEKENLEKIEEFLKSIPDDFPSIQKLARMAAMSSTKLKTRFKEVYGMKLYEYYNHNRLKKARQWIESGEASVQDVAYRVGFTNSSNFSKAFKKEFGVLPSQLKA
jgi:AraC-like DNA-binding protein